MRHPTKRQDRVKQTLSACLLAAALTAVVPASGDTMSQHLALARAAYLLWQADARPDRLETARQEAALACRLAPDNPEALEWAGLIALRQGRFSDALEPLRQAAALRPKRSALPLDLGYAYAGLGRDTEAIAAFEQAHRIAPDDPALLLRLAQARSLAADRLPPGSPEQARERDASAADLERTVLVNPASVEALTWLGYVRIAQARPAQALDPLHRALAIDPHNGRAQLQLAQADLALRHDREAANEFGIALREQPRSVAARLGLGCAQDRLGRSAEAVETLRQTLAQSQEPQQSATPAGQQPDDRIASKTEAKTEPKTDAKAETDKTETAPEAKIKTASVGESVGKPQAEATQNRIAPDAIQAALGLALEHTGALTEAADAYAEAVRLAPNRADYPLGLAHALLTLAERNAPLPSQDVQTLDKAVAALPGETALHCGEGALLLRTGHPEEAATQYTTAVHLAPNDFTGWQGLGTAEAKAGRHAEALTAFLHAQALQPDRPEAIRQVALEQRQNGRYAEASVAFGRLLALTPDDPDAWVSQALCLRSLGQSGPARDAMRAGLAATKNNVRPDAQAGRQELRLLLAADALHQSDSEGSREAAHTLYAQVVTEDPNNADALNGLGLLALRQAHDFQRRAYDSVSLRAMRPADLKREEVLLRQAHLSAKEAIRLFDHALTARPGFADALNNRGACREIYGDLPGAASDYRSALQADPKHVAGAANLARLTRLLKITAPSPR